MNILTSIRNALATAPFTHLPGKQNVVTLEGQAPPGGMPDDLPKVTISETRPGKLYQDRPHVFMTTPLFRRLEQFAGEPLVTPTERKQLDALQTRLREIEALYLRFTDVAVLTAARAKLAELESQFTTGDFSAADMAVSPDLLLAEARAKRDVLAESRRQLFREKAKIEQPIVERVGKLALDYHNALASEERKSAAELEIPFEPSLTLIALGRFSWNPNVPPTK